MTAVALLVDGTDLASVNRVLQMADDLFTGPVKRGGNILIPYTDGETRVDKKTDAKTVSVGYLISGGDSGGAIVPGQEFPYLISVYQEMLGLLPDPTVTGDMSCTLTLRTVLPSGTVDATASAEYVKTTFQRHPDSPRHAYVVVEFRLLAGVFA